MSVVDPDTKQRGIPCLSSEGKGCRFEVILEGRFDDIWKVDCHEYNILVEIGWRQIGAN